MAKRCKGHVRETKRVFGACFFLMLGGLKVRQEHGFVSHNTSLCHLLRSLYSFSLVFRKTGVLDLATEESDTPDVRDRGFLYWRLLSTDSEAATLVALGDTPAIFLVPRGHSFWNACVALMQRLRLFPMLCGFHTCKRMPVAWTWFQSPNLKPLT